MTKQSLARVLWMANQYEQMKENSEDRLVEVIQAAYSALATSNPELALNILKQMNEQSPQITEIIAEREVEEEAFIFEKAQQLPSELVDEDFQ